MSNPRVDLLSRQIVFVRRCAGPRSSPAGDGESHVFSPAVWCVHANWSWLIGHEAEGALMAADTVQHADRRQEHPD